MLNNHRFHYILGWVINARGYPEQMTVECIPPEGYPDVWSYGIWLKGRWSNVQNITACIDPNLCYSDPPGTNVVKLFC